MSRAGDLVIDQFAVGERPAVVRADIVDGEELAAHVEERNHLAVDIDEHLAGIGNLADFGHSLVFGHCSAHDTRLMRLPMARARASRTGRMVIRSKTCWKKPATTSRAASSAVRPRAWA